MNHSIDTFAGYNDLRLFRQTWYPVMPPRAALIIVHGFGEHSGRYMNIIQQLLPLGYAIYSYDHRGHGRSPGQRGHIEGWQEYREDLHAFVAVVQAEISTPNLFMLGHSLGGLIMLDYLLHYPQPLQGVIASAPALVLPQETPRIFMAAARLLNKIAPRFQISPPLLAAGISRDPVTVQAYLEDPLVHNLSTPRMAVSVQQTGAWVQQHATDFTLPLLALHGEPDKIVPIGWSRHFFDHANSADKSYISYPHTYHEAHNDLNHVEVVHQQSYWLEQHLV